MCPATLAQFQTVGRALLLLFAKLAIPDTAVLPLDRTALTAPHRANVLMQESKPVEIFSLTAQSAQVQAFAPHALLDITSGQVAPVVFNAVRCSITTAQQAHAKLASPIVECAHQEQCVQLVAVVTQRRILAVLAYSAQEAPISMEPWKLANPVITHV